MKNENLKIFLDRIEPNVDNTYSVYWGYDNSTEKAILVNEHESYLFVKRGTVITKPMLLPNLFLPGKHHCFFCTIITQKSCVVWNFLNHIFNIDASILPMIKNAKVCGTEANK